MLRPARLLQARAAAAQGQLELAALRQQEDAAIQDVLVRQRDVGLAIFTDGELRRGSWITDMAEAVDGFVPQSRTMAWKGPGGGTEASTSSVVGGRLQARRRLTAHESGFVRQHAPGRVKMTLPAPSNFFVASWKPGVSEAAYASRTEMAQDAARIIRAEIEALLDEGIDYIQLDAPFYSAFIDPGERERLQASGLDPDTGLRTAVEIDGISINGLHRAGATLALHVCRGNSRSRWLAEGAYDPIAEPLLGSLPVDAFLLEYDDAPRDGTFEPLRFLRPQSAAVLGLVTTKQPALESADALARRIDEAARYVPLDRLALSPQCGFASVAAGNLLSEADQWRKLELVVQTARQVWR